MGPPAPKRSSARADRPCAPAEEEALKALEAFPGVKVRACVYMRACVCRLRCVAAGAADACRLAPAAASPPPPRSPTPLCPSARPSAQIINDRAANRFPTPLDASNMDDVYVGR